MAGFTRRGLLGGAALVGFVPAAEAARRVPFSAPFPPGEIVVSQPERRLYLVLGDGTALSYPVAVGKAGKQWSGRTLIVAKYGRVAWSPPRSVKRDRPWLPDVIEADDPENPMGDRVLSLP
ncbi:MAG: L,D-transpeptidase, partial [Beijerinckiaceae bacterium]